MCCVTFGGHADPVEVAGEFLGHVRFASSWKTHHHDDGGGVGEVRGTGRCGEGWARGGNALRQLTVNAFLNKSEKEQRTASTE